MKNTTAIKKLEKIRSFDSTTDLQKVVIDEIVYHLEDYTKAEDFFYDLQRGGCASGMISSLIYYRDTYKFFDDFYSDIMDLLVEEDNQGLEIGTLLLKNGDIKNTGAWIAFEETARNIGRELGLDL